MNMSSSGIASAALAKLSLATLSFVELVRPRKSARPNGCFQPICAALAVGVAIEEEGLAVGTRADSG
jgi:hypothetical protein